MGRWKVKYRATHCPKGHEYSVENTGIGSKEERVCLTCQRERMRRKRERPDFLERERLAMRRYRARHGDRERKQAKANRRRKYEWLATKKLKCLRCEESHPGCLDFHHRDPSEKDVSISLVVWRWKLTRLEAEIAKCDVLCANCHRKLHWEERKANSLALEKED